MVTALACCQVGRVGWHDLDVITVNVVGVLGDGPYVHATSSAPHGQRAHYWFVVLVDPGHVDAEHHDATTATVREVTALYVTPTFPEVVGVRSMVWGAGMISVSPMAQDTTWLWVKPREQELTPARVTVMAPPEALRTRKTGRLVAVPRAMVSPPDVAAA
jgi:hypothetical protein